MNWTELDRMNHASPDEPSDRTASDRAPSDGAPSSREESRESVVLEPPSPELLGALDIVEAFTALRHELKLQVRGGRELQQSLVTSLERLEKHLQSEPAKGEGEERLAGEARILADAVAEMEESLSRSVEMLRQSAAREEDLVAALKEFDEVVAGSSRWARMGAGGLLEKLRNLLENSLVVRDEQDQSLVDVTRQGLDLLLARVHRLMEACDLQRVDVQERLFDAELMQAVDVIEQAEVPSAHVAEQLRPAYVWRGKILRCAHVRVAK